MKFIIAILIVFFFVVSGHGKCRENPRSKLYRSVYVQNSQTLVLGKVISIDPNFVHLREIEMHIQVEKVLKGSVSSTQLKSKFIWHAPFEGDRRYEVGKSYVFLIESIEGENVRIDVSNCTPQLQEAEVMSFLKKDQK